VPTFRICTAYKYKGRTYGEFDPSLPLGEVECVYEDLPAWTQPIAGCKSFAELPDEARRYVERIEQLVGRPIGLISVGLGREQTVVKQTRLKGLS
jgi:adenylosuccinate synthase